MIDAKEKIELFKQAAKLMSMRVDGEINQQDFDARHDAIMIQIYGEHGWSEKKKQYLKNQLMLGM